MSKSIGPPIDSNPSFTGAMSKSSFTRSSSSTAKTTQSSPIALQKPPRNTHRHHRKPEANLNHLLNFSYAPRNTDTQHVRRSKTTPSFGRGSGHHPLDKAHFVNANYRFIVHPSGDYRPHLLDSDMPLPWDHVLQILASGSTQRNACPVCLEDVPIAPRMAQCGHIFCLPCVLTYLDSEDLKTGKRNRQWRKCPMCFDAVFEKDLRPVRWVDTTGELPSKGQDVVLQLIKREAGSICALPVDSPALAGDVVPWYNQSDALQYVRICRGDAQYMEEQATKEIEELKRMIKQDALEFNDDGRWATMAIQRIEEMAEIHQDIGLAPKGSYSRKAVARVKTEDESADGSYYYYQPQAGQHYYLSSLDIRILKKAFGSFANLPAILLSKVEYTTTITIDDETRRRTKYLAHLPVGCEITILECDWSGILDPSVTLSFKTEIDRRRKKRHDKAITEESARRKAQAAEERRERAGLGEVMWQDEDTSYFARNDESNTYEVFADDIPSNHSGSLPANSYEHKSVWGQPLPPSAPPPEVNDDWSDQLQKFYEESAITASTSSKSKQKKKKLVLMTTGGIRRG